MERRVRVEFAAERREIMERLTNLQEREGAVPFSIPAQRRGGRHQIGQTVGGGQPFGIGLDPEAIAAARKVARRLIDAPSDGIIRHSE
ncbi:hypothetical protein [Micromonospora sp. RTGN7]|uniref:hypothetical protein n=1 Tax=Micromonospora sp. RTGN7 TaxID=3016526 RepID=UPI0029FF215B|nr:hypothetical protein [Micromonospora sp. RTGN7]